MLKLVKSTAEPKIELELMVCGDPTLIWIPLKSEATEAPVVFKFRVSAFRVEGPPWDFRSKTKRRILSLSRGRDLDRLASGEDASRVADMVVGVAGGGGVITGLVTLVVTEL